MIYHGPRDAVTDTIKRSGHATGLPALYHGRFRARRNLSVGRDTVTILMEWAPEKLKGWNCGAF